MRGLNWKKYSLYNVEYDYPGSEWRVGYYANRICNKRGQTTVFLLIPTENSLI